MWVLLVEKAWAKLHKSYAKIESGQPNESLRDLTGAPAYYYRLSETANWWDLFSEGDKKNFVFALGTPAD